MASARESWEQNAGIRLFLVILVDVIVLALARSIWSMNGWESVLGAVVVFSVAYLLLIVKWRHRNPKP